MSEEMRKELVKIQQTLNDLLKGVLDIGTDLHKLWEINDRMYGKPEETSDEENKPETDQKQP